MTLTLPIEIGKKYVRRDGEIVTAREPHSSYSALKVAYSADGDEPTANDGDNVWLESGKISRFGEHPFDLVDDYCEPVESPNGHPHAVNGNMALYAQDALETINPSRRWERRMGGPSAAWIALSGHPEWFVNCEYRRRPKTIRIGEFDVPEPLRVAPERNTKYYRVNVTGGLPSIEFWEDTTPERIWLNRGLLHLTEENAELHARALISFTEVKS